MGISGVHLATILGGVAVALISYFIKSFFDSLRSDIRTLAQAVHELRGSFRPLREDIKENTVQLARAQTELKAIWRYIDAPKRSSDASVVNQNGPSSTS